MSEIISNAYNFSNHITSAVEPRTGTYNISINLGEFLSHKTSGINFNLMLGYNAGSAFDMGFGRGWALTLSRYDQPTRMLTLSTGQSFEIEFDADKNEYDMPYRKLKDIRVFYLDESAELKIAHKDGRTEFIDYQEGTLQRIVSPNGLAVYFDYEYRNNHPALTRIYDNAGRELIIDWYSDKWETTVEHWVDDEIYQRILFSKEENGAIYQRLSCISFPDDDLTTDIEYIFFSSVNYDLIEKVTHFSGLTEEIEYKEYGFFLPQGAILHSIPCVTRYTLRPGENQLNTIVEYGYSDKNFLGFGSDRTWVAGEDTLFKANCDYKYTSAEKINGTQEIHRTYNKYHLLDKVEYKKDGHSYRIEENFYFADLNESIQSQSAKYSFLKEQHITYYHVRDSLTLITEYDYDEYGNQIFVKNSDGSEIYRTFYPADGEGNNCPPDPNGMVSLLKQETLYPCSTHQGEQPRTSIFTYTELLKLDDDESYFILVNEQTLHDRVVTIAYYSDSDTPLEYGRIQEKKENINGYINTEHFEYQFDTESLTTVHQLITHDELIVSSSETIHYTNAMTVNIVSAEGVSTEFTYDSMGRLTEEIYAPDTEYESVTQYQYRLEQGANLLVKIDAKENEYIHQINNAGKVIFESLNGNPIREYIYNNFGFLIKQLDTDYLDGKTITITTQYEYNDQGQVNKVLHQDGRVERIESNPAQLSSVYEMVGLIKINTQYNLSGQEEKKETRTIDGVLIAKTEFQYDGFGNLIETTDTHGRVTFMSYDNSNRVISIEKSIDNMSLIQSIEYAPFTTSDLVTEIRLNDIALGMRDYDGLARLTEEQSAGGCSRFAYPDDSAILPDQLITAKKAIINIENDIYLQKTVEMTGADDSTENVYHYDQISGELLSCANQHSLLSYQYNQLGQLESESVKHLIKGENNEATYRYSLLGRILNKSDFFGHETEYSYDVLGRMDKVSNESYITQIGYDDYSRPIRFNTTTDGQNQVSISLVLNAMGLEEKRTVTINGQTHFTLTQFYNDDLQIREKIHEENGEATIEKMEYDDLYRLVKYTCHGPNSPRDEKGNCILSQAFSHDIFGNIIETQTHFDNGTSNFTMYSYADDNPTQLIHLCNSHPQYPSDIEFRYDAAGNLLVDEKGRVYTYNELGQMLSVEQQGQVLSQYRYNAQGKVISQTYGHENKVTSLELYYQGEQLMNEYCHGIHTSYQGINGVVKGRVIHGSEGQHQLLFCNSQHSIISTLTTTSREEKQFERYQYTAYGETTSYPQSDMHPMSDLANNPLGYNGERRDPMTGFYHLGEGYRVYSPTLMRFYASDSASPFGQGGLNSYTYCLGDPINLRDPSGHFPMLSLLIGAIVGAVVGATVSAGAEGIRAAVTGTQFDWRQVGVGAALGAISGGFGVLSQGAKTGVQVGLAVADTVVSGTADFGLNVAMGSSTKDAGINAGIGTVIGLATFGLGMGLNSTSRANNPGSIYGRGRGNVTTTELSNKAHFSRKTTGKQWHQVIIDNNRTLWGTDMKTNHSDVAKHPLRNIARRNSSSDLHIYSGVHGAKKGNNWLMRRRDPYLNELRFYREDTVFKSYSSRYAPNREVYLINMGSINKNKFSEHLSRSGHHVQAYCFSRNDNFLLKRFNLEPVISFVPAET